MSFKSQRIRARARFGLRSLAVGALLWPAVSFGAPDPDRIAVYVDQAKLLKIPAKAATIIIGNPLIADVTLQSGGVVVVTGKGYGATNFIAMDRCWRRAGRPPDPGRGPDRTARHRLPRRRTRILTAACRSASAGSRSATASIISRRRSTRPARSRSQASGAAAAGAKSGN